MKNLSLNKLILISISLLFIIQCLILSNNNWIEFKINKKDQISDIVISDSYIESMKKKYGLR